MDIKNISIEEINYLKNKSLLKKTLEYANYYKSNVNSETYSPIDIIPQIPKYIVRFELIKTNPQFANMLRRVLKDEVEVYSFTFDIDDYKSNDIYILYDIIKQRLEALPISQDIMKLDSSRQAVYD